MSPAAAPEAGSFGLRLLGPVSAFVDGQRLALGGSKQRSVLAILALRARSVVSTDQLIEGLWGETPPETAPKMVQQYVSRLRKTLRARTSEADIATHPRGYELVIAPDALDVSCFERLVDQAANSAAAEGRAGAVRAALQLWRGPALADVVGEPFAAPEIRRLEERRLTALELDVDALLDRGQHNEALGRLEALICEHPLHERFRAQRMLALYRAGRQAEALDAYRVAHSALVEQVGVEPGPELRRLHAAILVQDPELELPAPQEELPQQLRGGSPVLAGRERELAALGEAWREANAGARRLVFISGARGIGKTRLAAEAAREATTTGGAVVYAHAAEPPASALSQIEQAARRQRPFVLVLDDADDAPPAVLEAAALVVGTERGPGRLGLVIHRESDPPPAFTAVAGELGDGGVGHLHLQPLGMDAVAQLAALLTGAHGSPMAASTLMAASDGIPLRIQRAATEWSWGQAADRLVAVAERAAAGRDDQRATEAELRSRLLDLQAARQRANDYQRDEASMPRARATAACPFRGLAPFEAAHAEYFFGRERLVAALVARLVGSTILTVVGPSGSGKSSLVRAGLRTALAEGVLPGADEWRQALLRPGEHPCEELERALARAVPDARQRDVEGVLRHLVSDERLVITVDQFEEVFTTCRDAGERARFIKALVDAARHPSERAIIILALRSDFYGACAEHSQLAALMSANQVLVGPMRRDELRRAIELPARRAGLLVERPLVDALVAEVADEPGGLPLLSTALVELWRQRDGTVVRHRTYLQTGGVRGAVARLAEQAYGQLSDRERKRARAMLLRLAGTTADGTVVRRRVAVADLGADTDADAAAALAVLTDRRLLTVDEAAVEVAHEALLREWPRLRSWLEEDEAGRRVHDHLIHASASWEASGRDAGELYRGARLVAALDWAAHHDDELNARERAFLGAAEAAAQAEEQRARRSNRRLRALLAGTAMLLAVAVVAGAAALDQRGDARRSAARADAERLGSEALVENRLDRSLLLARQGVSLFDSTGTRSNLLSALLRTPAAVGMLHADGDPLHHIALSPDGRLVVTSDDDGTVTFLDAVTGSRLGRPYTRLTAVWNLAFSPDGRELALTGRLTGGDAVVQLLDVHRRAARRTLGGIGERRGAALSYSPDGTTLVATFVYPDATFPGPGMLHRWNGRTGDRLGPPVAVTPSGSDPVLIAFSGERRLVTGGPRTPTRLRDARTLRVLRSFGVHAASGAAAPDGRTLALGGADGSLRLIDLRRGDVHRALGEHRGRIGSLAFSDDGQSVVTSGDDGRVIVWDVADGVVRETLSGHAGPVSAQALSPTGGTLHTAGLDGSAIVWDLAGSRRLGRPFLAGAAYPQAVAFAVSPDGRTVAVPQRAGVNLIDARTLQRRGHVPVPGIETVDGVGFTLDGRLIVVGTPGFVGLYDISGRPAPVGRPLVGHVGHVLRPAAARDLMVTAGSERVVRRWDLRRHARLGRPLVMPTDIADVAVTRDGSRFAIALADGSVRIHATRSARRIATLRTGKASVSAVHFSPGARLLIVADSDGATRLWSTANWRQVGEPLKGQSGDILAARIAGDGRTLATSSTDGTVALWDVASRQQIGSPLPGLPNTPVGAEFAAGGSRLFAVHASGRAYRWETSPRAWRDRACAVAGRQLTPTEWQEVLPERGYAPACAR